MVGVECPHARDATVLPSCLYRVCRLTYVTLKPYQSFQVYDTMANCVAASHKAHCSEYAVQTVEVPLASCPCWVITYATPMAPSSSTVFTWALTLKGLLLADSYGR